MQAAGPLERSGELEILESAVAGAAEGAGRVVVVEGPPGIGKSRLLDAAAESAQFLGARPLRARPGRTLSQTPFGIALQLLEPAGSAPAVVAAADPADGERDYATIHALYRLTRGLARERPLVLVVDDAHRADEASLRLCAYLAQRIERLPIALVLARRVGDAPPGPGDGVLATLAAGPVAHVLRPAPLSEAGVGRLVERTLAAPPAPEFVAACARLTGGNPYLVTELLGAAAAEGVAPAAPAVADLEALVPPQTVQRTVAARLAALPEHDVALARAVAVLGDGAALAHAAALAGLAPEVAARAADRLATSDLLRPGAPLAFSHPFAAAAVVASDTGDDRGAAHLRAAELLRADGAAAERMAAHLVAAPPGGRAWVVETLRAAARTTLAAGDPRAAAEQLRRALAEPAPPEVASALLLELGRAEAKAGAATAGDRFLAAAAVMSTPEDRAQTYRELARARVTTGDVAGARAAYADALAALPDRDRDRDDDLAGQLRGEELIVAALDPAERPSTDVVERILGDARVGATPVSRALLATLALHELYAGGTRAQTLALAHRAYGDGALLDDESAETTVYSVILVLFIGEELTRAQALQDELIRRARRDGAVMDLAAATYSRAWARLIAGQVRDAVEDAQAAVDAGAHGWRQFLAGAHGALAHALMDAGDHERAERAVAESQALEELSDVTTIQLLDARGRLHFTRGRFADAAADYLAAGELAAGQRNPLLWATWRSNAGLALARTGDAARARTLIEEELELARAFGAPRGIAVALRALGTVEGGARGIALLEEAIDALDGSEAGLERGRSLLALGAALRRAGRRAEAAVLLKDAVKLARAGGAGAVERRAAEELGAAGARTPRKTLHGPGALSPSERRVTRLAASGLTNREIAEQLVVTRKAVEWHLSNAYAKLGIASRKELPVALDAADAADE